VCQDKFAVFSFALPPRGKGKGKDKDIKVCFIREMIVRSRYVQQQQKKGLTFDRSRVD
jgi:hypothetical protein